MYKHLQVEFTNVCNLSCVECPQRLMERKKGHMQLDVFDKILHGYIVGQNLQTIIFHKDGEPLCHPAIETIVQDVSDVAPKVKLDIYTNGLLLKESFVDMLSTLPNKVWLLISFHFFNEGGHENNYDAASAIIKKCIKKQYRNIEFVMATHVIKNSNMDKLKEWKSHWDMFSKGNRQLSAVHINNSINPWTGLIEADNAATFPTCPYGDSAHMFIGNTGNALACCLDLEEKIVFGNIMQDTKEDILKARTAFYTKLNSGEVTGLCAKCLTKQE